MSYPILFFLTLILIPSWPLSSPPCSCTASVYSLRQTLASYPISTSMLTEAFQECTCLQKMLWSWSQKLRCDVCAYIQSLRDLCDESIPTKIVLVHCEVAAFAHIPRLRTGATVPLSPTVNNKTDTDVAIANRLISCRVIFGWHLQKRQNLPIG